VVYIEQASEASLQALLEELNQRGLEIVAVVPKIGSAMVGLTRTEGLWIFWKETVDPGGGA